MSARWKVLKKLRKIIPVCDFSNDKLGGHGKLVQIDETMMNHSVKSHRGRASRNRTDSICIVELEGRIKRCFARVIPNKSQAPLLPIN